MGLCVSLNFILFFLLQANGIAGFGGALKKNS
jgi:hypothetical protein